MLLLMGEKDEDKDSKGNFMPEAQREIRTLKETNYGW